MGNFTRKQESKTNQNNNENWHTSNVSDWSSDLLDDGWTALPRIYINSTFPQNCSSSI